jgi:hypothetical protein
MPTVTGKPAVRNGKVTDIATAPVPDTLASLHVDTDHPTDARLLNRGDALRRWTLADRRTLHTGNKEPEAE